MLHSRRQALSHFANGFGLLGLAHLFASEAQAEKTNPISVRTPHFPARAKRVIFVFMSGGPSHVDLFDPKPRLRELHGKALPFEKPKLERTKTGSLLASPYQF